MNDVLRNGTRETCPVCGDDYTVELPHNCSVVADLEQQLAELREAIVNVYGESGLKEVEIKVGTKGAG